MRLSELIEKVNELFEGELTEDDQLIYVNNVLKGKLLESETLRQQAASNIKARFWASPDLNEAVLDAAFAARTVHKSMSEPAINDERVRRGLVDILVNFTDLNELLRGRRRRCRRGSSPGASSDRAPPQNAARRNERTARHRCA